MSASAFTVEEKLAAVEHLIEIMRWARSHPDSAEHQTREMLKAIAVDLRAQLAGAGPTAMLSLETRINLARREKARIGYYEIRTLQGIGEEVIGRWPVISRALAALEGAG